MKKSIISKISIISVVVCVFLSCEKDSEIVFSPAGVPVDLGLSVKWASCNVGANSPEDYGDHFAWGEGFPKNEFSYEGYLYKDNPNILPPYADAATVNWGGAWRMPTDIELTELCVKCTWTWTTQNGVNGYKVTSKSNGNSIFLPAAGCRVGSSLNNAGSRGYYWSSSLITDYPYNAWHVYFNSSSVSRYDRFRYNGQSVRPVCP